jgi:predicted PurR-regulated permease PerM
VSVLELIPRWLVRVGLSAWTIVGFVLATVVSIAAIAVLLPALTPVILAILLAAVLYPVVGWMTRFRVPRGAALAIATLAVPVLAVALILVVASALSGEAAEWENVAQSAGQEAEEALGVDIVTPVIDPDNRRTIFLGLAGLVVNSAAAIFSLAIGVLVGLYTLFFLLKDGPRMGSAVVERVPLPQATSQRMLGDATRQLRRYVVGTTIIATMNTISITIGAAVLGLPLLPVIALVTFVCAYIPYVGAWLSGFIVVVVALGSGGLSTALWMLAVVLVTQIIFEAVAVPLVFGATLELHPLIMLGATMLAGAIAGVMGVFIAPPVAGIAAAWSRALRAPRPANDDPEPETGPQVAEPPAPGPVVAEPPAPAPVVAEPQAQAT